MNPGTLTYKDGNDFPSDDKNVEKDDFEEEEKEDLNE
jgi:hypothetical protein